MFLCPTVFHLLGAACFTLLAHPRLQQQQWPEGRVAGMCWRALSPLRLFPLGQLSKQAAVGFSPNPSVTGTPTCPDAR